MISVAALPILADAMEDAEFNDIGILYCCRNDPNAGNWIVAFVLEEQEMSMKWLQAYADMINGDMETNDNSGWRITVEELLEVVEDHIESGQPSLGFGFDIPYGETWMTPENLEGLRKHAEVLLKATMTPKDDFQPFRCAC